MTLSRRDLIAAALATPAVASAAHAQAAGSGFVTSAAGQRFAPTAGLDWSGGAAGAGAGEVRLFPDQPRQTLLGFGGAFTDAACTVIGRMPAPARAQLLAELYGPDGLGLSVGRACIGASDYSTELFGYDEGAPDPTLARFSIDHDRAHVLPTLKAALAVNPELFLFASPWSPPGWMKYGGSMKGGSIRPENLPVYAAYIGKYLDAYAAAGAPIRAVTVQNETDADQGGRMAACAWPQETEDVYIAQHLGPMLAARGGRTKLWILDHNYDLWGRVLDQLDKPEVRAVVDAVAWHGYVGAPDKMAYVHAARPEFGAHWTEGGAMIDDPDYLTGWSRWATTFAGVLNNQAQSITVWNLALDETGRPNIGPFTCGGLVTVDSATHAVRRSALYYALGHYARAFRRGDRVVRSETSGEGLACAAAQGPDGRLSLVLTNAGSERMVTVRDRGRAARWRAPADSVASFSWAA